MQEKNCHKIYNSYDIITCDYYPQRSVFVENPRGLICVLHCGIYSFVPLAISNIFDKVLHVCEVELFCHIVYKLHTPEF